MWKIPDIEAYYKTHRRTEAIMREMSICDPPIEEAPNRLIKSKPIPINYENKITKKNKHHNKYVSMEKPS